MRKFVLLGMLAVVSLPVWAVDATTTNFNAEDVIRKFAAKETEFARARENYTYRQTVKIEELDQDGNPGGKYEMVEDVIFSPEGKRTEKVVYAPVSTLRNLILTPEDEQDLRNVQPFVLTSAELPEYQIDYLGRQKVDEIGCFVFSVKPQKLLPGKRYFEGEVWVDDRDLQIVKTYGKGVGLLKRGSDNQFPKFETYRQQIDGRYWFPTYTRADDTLYFRTGPQRIRMIVKYEDYKQFKPESVIKYGDVVSDKPETPPPAKKP